jgi:uncharacterized membrane protein
MLYQEATSVISLPLDVLQTRLQDVERWPSFIVGLESATKLGHERYRFSVADGGERREVVVAVRRIPGEHRVDWRSLEGPRYRGRIELHPVDDRHTTVRLCLESHPGTLTGGFAEMFSPKRSRAVHDLHLLEQHVLAG